MRTHSFRWFCASIRRAAGAALLAAIAACGGGGTDGVGEPNSAPVASAGSPQNVATGSLVTLNGSASSDANGDPLTFAWTLTARPAGSTPALAGATTVAPSFTADRDGTYVASLTVNDGKVSSSPATVTITAATANSAPVANAGSAQNVATGSLVTLNGSASSDANGDPLTFAWTLTARPAGSTPALAGATTVAPSFTADRDGTYVASLTVNDGKVSSSPATVTITAAATAPAVRTGIRNIYTFIHGCATSDPVYATIRNDFKILNGGQIFTGTIACSEPYTAMPGEQMTEELLTVQTLWLVYYMSIGTEGRLPWTPLSLYDWMKSQIAGVSIVDQPGNSSCCLVLNGAKYMTVSRKPTSTLGFYRDWTSLIGWAALFAHETRHAAGYPHVTGCPAWPQPTDPLGCDPSYDESNLGAYGIQRWLFAHWATGELNIGIACGTPSDAMRDAQTMERGANNYVNLFVTNSPGYMTAPTPYGGICYPP